MLVNEKKFRKNKFNELSISADSSIRWFSVAADNRNDFPYITTRSHIQRSDKPFDVAELQQEISRGFSFKSNGARTMPYKNAFQNAITFELSLSELQYKRDVYSILDYFRDIGGLISALYPFC